jgi:Hydantoinase B/oxoprolinase
MTIVPDNLKPATSGLAMTSSVTPNVDPITRSVVQHRLTSIVTEMGEAMLRTSYSQILNSSRDFSIAICDTQARLIAQADHIPIHVGALPWATRAVEEKPRLDCPLFGKCRFKPDIAPPFPIGIVW